MLKRTMCVMVHDNTLRGPFMRKPKLLAGAKLYKINSKDRIEVSRVVEELKATLANSMQPIASGILEEII